MTYQTKAQKYADRCESLAAVWGIGCEQSKFLNEVAVELRRIDAVQTGWLDWYNEHTGINLAEMDMADRKLRDSVATVTYLQTN